MFRKIAVTFMLVVALPALVLAHSGSHKKVLGTVSRIEKSKLHIKTSDGRDSHVELNDKTAFVKSGKKASAKDVMPGSRVVVELTTKGAAEKVTIGKTMKAPKH